MRKTDPPAPVKVCSSQVGEKAGGRYPIDSGRHGTPLSRSYYEPYVASTPTSCHDGVLPEGGFANIEARCPQASF